MKKQLRIFNFHKLNTSPVWHDYKLWEDYKNGMYNNNKRSEKIINCLEMFKSDILHWFMWTALENYKYSSEVHLTQKEFNRKAWVGQATCNFHFNATIPETTNAWFMLTKEQREKANRIAQDVIEEWEYENFFGKECI